MYVISKGYKEHFALVIWGIYLPQIILKYWLHTAVKQVKPYVERLKLFLPKSICSSILEIGYFNGLVRSTIKLVVSLGNGKLCLPVSFFKTILRDEI